MTAEPVSHGSAREVARIFLRLGLTAFGGPAAHIAMFRQEFVTQRQWLTDEHFMDLLGATNLIPGPNSTEMAIHIGFLRAGWRGLIAAGVCFILPAFLIVLALAGVYASYGTTPAAAWLLYGIKPVIIAVVLQAIWGLSRSTIKHWSLGVLCVAVLGLSLLGINEIVLLLIGGLIVLLARSITRMTAPKTNIAGFIPFIGLQIPLVFQNYASLIVPVSLAGLFLTFLKIGSVLYGSGYVLLAFLRTDFVEALGWLTNKQLLDAVAIGQFTPGPVFTTATFIGYIIAGVPGAILSTIGIFLPSFVFVFLSHPFIPRLRKSPTMSALLDGVNVAALGLMAAVTLQLGQNALVDPLTIGLALAAAVLLIRFKVNSTWLIVSGAVVGLMVAVVRGTLA